MAREMGSAAKVARIGIQISITLSSIIAYVV